MSLDRRKKEALFARIDEIQGTDSNRSLSLAMGKSANYWTNTKRDNSIPSLNTLDDFCQHYNISLRELFNDNEDISYDEESFYRRLKQVIDPKDYKALNNAAAVFSKEFFHEIAEVFSRHTEINKK